MKWTLQKIDNYQGNIWEDWRELYERHHAHNPMLDPKFVSTLVEFFPDVIYVAKGIKENKLQSLLLLKKLSKGRWSCYTPSQTQVAPILSNPSHEAALKGLMHQISPTCFKFDLLYLDPAEHSSFIHELQQQVNYATNIQLHLDTNFEEYWNSRPRNLRKNISRHMNRIEGDDRQITIKIASTPEKISAAVDHYGILESQGWKGLAGTALHPANKQGQFYRILMKKFAETSGALAFETYIDNQLAASRLCIHNEKALIILKTSFDEALRKYSPGKINLYNLIQFLHQQELVEYIDFYTNASNEQKSWSTAEKAMISGSIYKTHYFHQFAKLLKRI